MAKTAPWVRVLLYGVLVVTVYYVAIAMLVYAIGHSEKTQAQVFLNFWDAMCWR